MEPGRPNVRIDGHLFCFVCHKLEVKMPGRHRIRDVEAKILPLQESYSLCRPHLELTCRALPHRIRYFPALLRYIPQVCFWRSKFSCGR